MMPSSTSTIREMVLAIDSSRIFWKPSLSSESTRYPESGLRKSCADFQCVRSGTALFMPSMTTRSSSSLSRITAAAPLTGVIALR
jgi:hypothetical protein